MSPLALRDSLRGLLVGAGLAALVVGAPGCLDPMPVFGAPCDGDDDCRALGVCFDGACVPKDFPGLPGDERDDGGPSPDAGGGDDGGEGDDAGSADSGTVDASVPPGDAGNADGGDDDAGDDDAGDDDAGDDDAGSDDAGPVDGGDGDDAGPPDAGFDAGPLPVCGDGVVAGDEDCDWGGRNGVGDVPCTASCVLDFSSPRRVNLDPLGGQLSGLTAGGTISANGRFVLYWTRALDVANAATEGDGSLYHLALLDLTTGTTVVIDAGGNGGVSSGASLSADGEVVVFASTATNLTTDTDTNGESDVFAYRRSTGEIRLLSKNPTTGAAANSFSYHPWVDAAGTTVVFASYATDLVEATTVVRGEIFKVELDAPGQIIHVSTSEGGGLLDDYSDNPLISGDGSTIAFYMYATNFFGADTNGSPDSVFVRDGARGYISRPPGGGEATGPSYVQSISHDGDLVTFRTSAQNLSGSSIQQSILFDRKTGQLHRIAWSAGQPPNAQARDAIISGDGRFVAFPSGATNLVTNDSSTVDIYVRAVEGFSTSGVPTRVTSYNSGAGVVAMPYDGSLILFTSDATDIVPNDTNGFHDVFLVKNPLHP